MAELDRRQVFRLLRGAAIGGAAVALAPAALTAEPVRAASTRSVLFVDPECVDIEELVTADLGADFPFEWIVAVRPKSGMSVSNSIAFLGEDAAIDILSCLCEQNNFERGRGKT